MEVAKWMRSKGANTVVLISRSLPVPSVQYLLDSWNRNCNIIVMQADVGEYESCKQILELIKQLGLPPLRGIMHAAGVLSDNMISKQTLESIEYVLKPKVYGSWHLHNLTLDYQMEFFVMFS